jgi:glutaredoxin
MVSRLYHAVILSFALFSLVNVQAAVKIVECEDEKGNRSFQKICPPNSTMIGEKKLSTGAGSADTSNVNINAILYSIPDCEACDEIKEFLGSRNIPITEKNVNDNIELQNELTELTGALKVPTTVIGEEVLTGYSRSKFLSILEAAGYKDEDS